jgi:hypothetical protein
MRAAIAALLTVALLVLAAGCGGGDGGGSASGTTDDGPVPELPACAGARGAQSSASAVQFPLPAGTRIISSNSPFEGQLVVLGLVPADLQEAAAFFNDALPEQGYQVGIGDSEGSESEAPFTGNGYRGKWRVNSIPDCDAVRLTLVLIEQA